MKFIVLQSDDWQAVYLNGQLITQDHRISAIQLLRNLDGYRIEEGRLELEVHTADPAILEDSGEFPPVFDDSFVLY